MHDLAFAIERDSSTRPLFLQIARHYRRVQAEIALPTEDIFLGGLVRRVVEARQIRRELNLPVLAQVKRS